MVSLSPDPLPLTPLPGTLLIPPAQSAEFVCAMEDVLEVYQRPYDENEALVCMDETSKQQVKETRAPRPAAPGAVPTYDYEYERNGVSSLFMLFAPLDGWRRVEVRERRTKVDWAHVIKRLVDEDYADNTGAEADVVSEPKFSPH